MKPKSRPNFADWKTHGDQRLIDPLNVAARFCNRVRLRGAAHDRAGHTLTFCGVSGIGKTFLADCMLNELGRDKWGQLAGVQGYVRNGEIIRATYMRRDWRKISDGFKTGDYEIVEDLEKTFLLMLDDIGADHDPSGVGASKLDRVVRSRVGKWTILTCNLSLPQIAEKLDTRIASFLIRDENEVCEIVAEDYATRELK
jgi:DNA replication protein DnaC